jgi:hypothetical protein
MISPAVLVRFPPALLAAVDASIAGQSQRLSRPEEIRRLIKERLAGEPAPTLAPAASSEDTAQLRSRLIALAGKVDGLIAYAREVERQRDALADRAPRLEVVREPLRAPPSVERWPRSPPHSPPRDGLLSAPSALSRGSNPRDDPEAVARARAQLAAAEAAAEARRLQESAPPRD